MQLSPIFMSYPDSQDLNWCQEAEELVLGCLVCMLATSFVKKNTRHKNNMSAAKKKMPAQIIQ